MHFRCCVLQQGSGKGYWEGTSKPLGSRVAANQYISKRGNVEIDEVS